MAQTFVIARNKGQLQYFAKGSAYDCPGWAPIAEAQRFHTSDQAIAAVRKMYRLGEFAARVVESTEEMGSAVNLGRPDKMQTSRVANGKVKTSNNKTFTPKDGESVVYQNGQRAMTKSSAVEPVSEGKGNKKPEWLLKAELAAEKKEGKKSGKKPEAKEKVKETLTIKEAKKPSWLLKAELAAEGKAKKKKAVKEGEAHVVPNAPMLAGSPQNDMKTQQMARKIKPGHVVTNGKVVKIKESEELQRAKSEIMSRSGRGADNLYVNPGPDGHEDNDQTVPNLDKKTYGHDDYMPDMPVLDKDDNMQHSPLPLPPEDNVKVPAEITSQLSKEIEYWDSQATLYDGRDDARASYAMTVHDAMVELKDMLALGTVEGLKMAQISYQRLMSPITTKIPADVTTFILRGGRPSSLKDLFIKHSNKE